MARRPRQAAREAEEGIRNYILSHRLRAGDLLPSEAVLCEELGCSRSSLREAVRTLSSLDIVEVRHGHGTFVSRISLAPLLRGLILRITLDAENSLENLRHVVDTRELLDLSVAEELVGIHHDRPVDDLQALVQAMRERSRAGAPFAAEDSEFHATLLARVANPLVVELSAAFREVYTQVLPMLGLSPPRDSELIITARVDMLHALAHHDAAAYRAAVRRYHDPLRRAVTPRSDTAGEPDTPQEAHRRD